ncbi:hypothetical protein PENSPDRAFT_264597 [Peniophora sp. CONT]|nr:hypothetical protein PENSPDRAFT_264597 [Peniophora sp. CONT]
MPEVVIERNPNFEDSSAAPPLELSSQKIDGNKRKRRRNRKNRARTLTLRPDDITPGLPLEESAGADIFQNDDTLAGTYIGGTPDEEQDDDVGYLVPADEIPPGYDELGDTHPSDVKWCNDKPDGNVDFLPPSYDFLNPNLLPLSVIRSHLRISTSSTSTWICDHFTYLHQLRVAENDSHFEIIRAKLTTEWQEMRTNLIMIAVADAAVYGFSPQTAFKIDKASSKCLVLSAISAALGLCLIACLQLRYLKSDAASFATLARVDQNREGEESSSYTYFAITSRLPLLAFYLSLTTFSLFLLAVAYVA